VAHRFVRIFINSTPARHCCNYGCSDLKPENLLLSSHYNLKVADWGLTAIWDGYVQPAFGSLRGTPEVKSFERPHHDRLITCACYELQYMPPEILETDAPYMSTGSDIFAAGILLFILFIGTRPFDVSYNVLCVYL
jgi:serine/threonine protein kinase